MMWVGRRILNRYHLHAVSSSLTLIDTFRYREAVTEGSVILSLKIFRYLACDVRRRGGFCLPRVWTTNFQTKLSRIDFSLTRFSYRFSRLRAQSSLRFQRENFPEVNLCALSILTGSMTNTRQDITHIIYLPRSSRLSSMLTALAWCEGPIDSLMPGLPGWITRTRATPRTALSKDVSMKYTRVRTAIIPFILAFKLAEPGARVNNAWKLKRTILRCADACVRWIPRELTRYKTGDHQR